MVRFDDEDQEDTPRTAAEIARRALVLSGVITCACGAPAEIVLDWLKAEGLYEDVSDYERDFLRRKLPDEARGPLTWRIEALLVLLWCINKIDRLPPLSDQSETEPLQKAVILPPAPITGYVSSARLRDQKAIEEEREKVFDAHWTVRDAQIHGRDVPDGLDPDVIYERHYAFNWVVGYMGQSWDEITTDT